MKMKYILTVLAPMPIYLICNWETERLLLFSYITINVYLAHYSISIAISGIVATDRIVVSATPLEAVS